MEVLTRRRSGYIPIDDFTQILEHNSSISNNGGGDRSYRRSNSTTSGSTSSEQPNKEEIIHQIYGYKRSTFRLVLFHTFSVLFLGIPYLLFNWFPTCSFHKYKKYILSGCDRILVTNNQGQSTFVRINRIKIDNNSDDSTGEFLRTFDYQHVIYIWSDHLTKFVRLENPDDRRTIVEVLNESDGITEDRRKYLKQLYGPNTISVQVKSYWTLFRTEILSPFYLFQFFSIVLWCLDDYYYYAGCILFLSLVSIGSSLYETRTQSVTLKHLVESTRPDSVQIRNHEKHLIDVPPEDLVPGDVIVLPVNGMIMPTDAILLTGTAIVNESMLTGESVPMMKTPPTKSHEPLSYEQHKRHILFAGTHVVQTRAFDGEKVYAKILRTGFNTCKGDLIKSILFPQAIGFQFYQDSIKFVTALFCIAILGMMYCVRVYMAREEKLTIILLRTLDVITIVVPPALPMAMTAGTVYSQSRLKKLGIFCISPPRINVCGKIKLVCFDKTGTLTDDNLTLHGIIEYKKTHFDNFVRHPATSNPYTEFIQAMAACHSLTIIDGELTGDPLDLEIFKSINWKLIEPGPEHSLFDSLAPVIVRPADHDDEHHDLISFESEGTPYLIGILKCFQFSSERQCMSVVARVHGHKHMKIFTKGAPEKMRTLCDPSTIPEEYFDILHNYTAHGYRVLALAYRELSAKVKWKEINGMRRDDIERRLTFLGFVVLQNCLKPETKPVIEDLHAANIRTVMITGDNLMTAISVARDCRMVLPDEDILVYKSEQMERGGRPVISVIVDRNRRRNSLESTTILDVQPWKYRSAMDGHTWTVLNQNYPEIVPQILARGTIFARFAPEQKSNLVCLFQQMDYIVAMCGDGANDCSALRAAHIGISLSQAEASVAAPFTSKIPNINCVKLLALEGRCALVTSFGIFKYMTLYSLIQFCTILILYSKCSLLGNAQFLYIDLVITASLAFTMGNQGPSDSLVMKRPMSSLISLANTIPIFLQITVCAAIQLTALIFLMHQKWYDPSAYLNFFLVEKLGECKDVMVGRKGGVTPDNVVGWENTVIFLISCFQYLILGAIYCKGKPYRQPVYKNYIFMFFLISLTAITSIFVIHPLNFMASMFEIEPFVVDDQDQQNFRLLLICFPIVHLFASIFIEYFIAERIWFKKVIHFLTRKSQPKNKFKLIENELETNGKDWLDIIQR